MAAGSSHVQAVAAFRATVLAKRKQTGSTTIVLKVRPASLRPAKLFVSEGQTGCVDERVCEAVFRATASSATCMAVLAFVKETVKTVHRVSGMAPS